MKPFFLKLQGSAKNIQLICMIDLKRFASHYFNLKGQIMLSSFLLQGSRTTTEQNATTEIWGKKFFPYVYHDSVLD